MGWNEKRHNFALLIFLLLAVIPLSAFTYSTREGMKAVKITDGTNISHCYTSAQTVAQLLKEQNITLDYNDLTRPAMVTPITSGMEVVVRRIEVGEYREQVEYTASAKVTRTSVIPTGKEIVITPGQTGVREVVRQVAKVNGVEVLGRTLTDRVIREAEQQTSIVGTGTPVAGTPDDGERIISMEATAYAPDVISCGKSDGITATGVRAGYGIVAVDRRVIPLGTRLYVEGYGPALAADVGGAIRGNRIDLCFNTHAEAVRYGRRRVKVHILD
ncbi:MAG TPA: 3D domain-containing protein [bacterium]|nr:3D domain-containing protein [bacterium]